MASDFGKWFYIALAGLSCVKGTKANGRRAADSVVFVPKSGLIFAGDVESPLVVVVVVVLLLLLRLRIAIAAAFAVATTAAIASL